MQKNSFTHAPPPPTTLENIIFIVILGLHRLMPSLALLSTVSWLLVSLVPKVDIFKIAVAKKMTHKVAAVVVGRFLAGFFVISLASLSPNYISTVASRCSFLLVEEETPKNPR